MLRPYLKIWDWELVFGPAVMAISSLGFRSPCLYSFLVLLGGKGTGCKVTCFLKVRSLKYKLSAGLELGI